MCESSMQSTSRSSNQEKCGVRSIHHRIIAIKQTIKASTEQKQHELILICTFRGQWHRPTAPRPDFLTYATPLIRLPRLRRRSRESLVLSRFIQISKREDSFISRSILQGEHEQERRRCVERKHWMPTAVNSKPYQRLQPLSFLGPRKSNTIGLATRQP
jgi:hypothetical protein